MCSKFAVFKINAKNIPNICFLIIVSNFYCTTNVVLALYSNTARARRLTLPVSPAMTCIAVQQ